MIGLILAAAGSGSRFGTSVPKQFTELQGRPLYIHALEAFTAHCQDVVIVLPETWKAKVHSQLSEIESSVRIKLEIGGSTRQESVGKGLHRLNPEVELVLVHDAARPFCPPNLIDRVIEGVRRTGACVPVVPVSDTVKELEHGRVVRTLDRSTLGLAQTPQGFSAELLRRAFDQALETGFNGTDEAMLVEQLGESVEAVPGHAGNIKVTWKGDL